MTGVTPPGPLCRPAGEAASASSAKPAAANAHTPGPWGWFGNRHGIYLATEHSGRRYVMGFRRHGTQGAQPTFRVAGRIMPASDLVEFEVGDQVARGFTEGKADPSVYRFDIRGIDCPDARLIASAPVLLDALERLARDADQWSGQVEPALPALAQAWDAIALAKGTPS